ncbi:MAG: hypothetical protein INR72_20550 [Williamsia herbipolensis]|nr:hypothetical protein [Williamsia herbipolensis]
MTEAADAAVPTAIRRLDTAPAARLGRLVGVYDDLQTTLRCCERLVSMLGEQDVDEVGVEALWTLALICYGRGFTADGEDAVLTEDDLTTQVEGLPAGAPPAPSADELVRRHRILLHLRDHHTDPSVNPRDTYTVGIAQNDDGVVNAVAVTSVHAPELDETAVRQAGAMTLPLCAALDRRIGDLQRQILDDVRDTPKDQLESMDLIEVAVGG